MLRPLHTNIVAHAALATAAALAALGRRTRCLATPLLLTTYPTRSRGRVLGCTRPNVDPAQRAPRTGWMAAVRTFAARGARRAGAIQGTAPFLTAFAGCDLWRFARPAVRPMGPTLSSREAIGTLPGACVGAVSAFRGNVVTAGPGSCRVPVPYLVGAGVMGAFVVRLRRGPVRVLARRCAAAPAGQAS